MSIIAINQNKKTATATFLPYAAYKRAEALALSMGGQIGKTDKGFFKADFSSAKIAKDFVTKWTAEYAAAHDAYVPKSAPASEPTPAPAKETKKSKPANGKGNSKLTGNDWVKANPSCTREEAAAHGLKGITKLELKALKKELGVR